MTTDGIDLGTARPAAGEGLGPFPAPPGSLTSPPGPAAAGQWLALAQRWLAVAGNVVARLDADAAAATGPDAYAADVMLAVTLTQTVTERLRSVGDALGTGAVDALGELCHGRKPVGTNLTGSTGGFNVAEAAALLAAVVARLAAAVAGDAVVASGAADTLSSLRRRITGLRAVATATGLAVDADRWEHDLDAAIATQDPARIRAVVTELARRVTMFEKAVAQVASDQERAHAAARDAQRAHDRAVALRGEVLALVATAQEKLVDPPHLGVPDPEALGPVPTVPDHDDPGAWVERAAALEARAARGERVVAALEQAERTYRSALESREALRGLLGAYRDRQLRRATSGDLDAAYEAARQACWVAPCDLAAARRLVDAYVIAVRAATPPGAPRLGAPAGEPRTP